MPQEPLPKQTLSAKVLRRGQLDECGQGGLITSRILIETAWDFVQAKCSLCVGSNIKESII